jgi:hypothetical protein
MLNNSEEKGADLQEIRRTISTLHEPNALIELCAIVGRDITSGYYSDHDALARDGKRLSDSGMYDGVYVTVNPVKPDVPVQMGIKKNRMYKHVVSRTKDKDIAKRRWFVLDVDPVRKPKTSANDRQKAAACWCKTCAVGSLRSEWAMPDPVIADSGNGYYALYRTDVPNNQDMDKLFRNATEAAAAKFSIKDVAVIDPVTHNPSRLIKLFGTQARKGPDTARTPHRFSELGGVPKNLRTVTCEQLEAFVSAPSGNADAGRGAAAPEYNASVTSQKLQEFLNWAGISIRSAGDYQGGMRWVLQQCLFNPEHNRGEVCVIRYPSGALKYSCLHQHCAENDWAKFRAAVEERMGTKFKFVESSTNILYESTPAGILWHKSALGGDKSDVLLTNFPARFTADITEDDGVTSQHAYQIEARISGRTRCVTVSASDLTSSNWPLEKLGGRAVLLQPGPTNRDRVRIALQLISTDMEERTVFTHTGWRKVDHEWLYLHAGGAISAQGFRDDISVSLPTDLEKFRLPAPPTGAQRVAVVRASLRFLDVAPRRITVPAYAGIWRAVWGNPGFSQFFAGPTGTYKSSCASLCQAHFGAAFDWEHLPGSWRCTANATAELQFKLKDTLFTVDDFVPKGSLSDVQRAHLDADKVLRGAANNAARGRLGRDSLLKESKPPRCFTLSTGEDIPRGQSLQARLWITDFTEGDVDFKRLKLCADDASRGLFSAAMSAYVQWAAAHRNSIEKDLRRCVQVFREAAARHGQHAKTPQMVAELAAGLKYFLLFAKECGVLTQEEAKTLFKESWQALIEGGKIQTRGLADEEPAQRFVGLISSALVNARDAHLGKADSGKVDDEAKGRCIGWSSGDSVLLDPDNAYAVANELAKAQGEALSVDKRTMWKRLRQQGFLSCWEKDGHNTVVRKIGIRRQRVLSVWKRHIIQPAPEVVDSSSVDDSLL